MKTRTSVCVIPARGGSKRIPRKNIRDFCGKPMIAWSIEAALESELFERVIVSTDDEEIADVARTWGAEVPFMRPAELADDHAGTDAVFLNALKFLESRPQFACCLYATAPLVTTDDLKRGLEQLEQQKAISAFSVTTFDYPIFRALRLNHQGYLEIVWPEHLNARSQDLPEVLHDAGQFYWVDVDKYTENPKVFSAKAVPVVIPRYRVQDIDTAEDWKRAELVMMNLRKKATDSV